ncbi:DUF6468 domain-containing protein [Asticcacaulis sp. AND118]|uniref:DUF6468 domain-containing protein n=1 Tax=Asticcacaulis sp. AND118 TaxID=2840468 RepID=UPI001CFFCB17|nr:DUF6468 domain-containing protein [Asticcacaulis sp. AND118]UDF02726.1 DUF6468 domain-containing protein [Asticcacaulis sp. AND118]
MPAAAGLIMDMVLMGLLLVALWYGMRLNARLKALRNGQESFIKAVAELDQAAIKAHASLRELHTNADESQELLHGRILAARDLLSKLETQINRAERARRELEDVPVAPVSGFAEPEPQAEPPLQVARQAQRENWAGARGAEGRQTYAGRGRPAFEDTDDQDDAADDFDLPLSGRLRDMNDRLSKRAVDRDPPREASIEQEAVSALGLEAINEMLRAFADPEDIPQNRAARRVPDADRAPVREDGRRSAPERQAEPRAARPDTLKLSRTRLPSALDDELFDGDRTRETFDERPDATPRPETEPDPKPARPLFRRLR